MADQEHFSDDISALWGADDAGFLSVAPVARPEPALHNEPNGQLAPDGPLRAMQAELQRLADVIETNRMAMVRPADLESLRTQLQLDVGQELAQLHAAVRVQVDERLATAEAQARSQAEQHTEALANRLSALEGEARRRIAEVAAAIDAHEMEPVGKHRARRLREELEAEIAARLTAARTEAAAQIERRVEEAVAAHRAEIEALRHEHQALAAGVAEAAAASHENLEAMVARLESRLTDQADADRAARAELRSLLVQASLTTTDLATVQADLAEAASSAQLGEVGVSVARLETELAQLADAWRESRANLAAERHSVAGQLAELGSRVDEAHATAINSDLEQRVVQLGSLVDLHHAQTALASDLERLRTQLEHTIAAQVAEVRAELQAAQDAAAEGAHRRSLWGRHRPQHEA